MTDSMTTLTTGSCLGRTCLKWSEDGELTALDLDLVLQRLARVDEDVAALHQLSPESEACPSIS